MPRSRLVMSVQVVGQISAGWGMITDGKVRQGLQEPVRHKVPSVAVVLDAGGLKRVRKSGITDEVQARSVAQCD